MVVNSLYYDSLSSSSAAHFSAMPTVAFNSDVLERALMNIYSKDFHPMTDIERNLFHEFWRTYNLATDEGIKQGKEPDELFREALRHNNGVFAAFKVHRMQNDMARQLLTPNGTLKPFEQWKNDVQGITNHQCGAWLRTEYDTAVLRARQAANWQQFLQEADVLPNLKWIPSTSPNPGADHRPFWGTVLPIDHPFWTKHRPGDRWNCKCDLSNTDEPATTAPDGSPVGNNPHPGLDNNPGIDAKLFSDSHPYIANAYKGAQQAVKKAVKEVEEKEKEYQRLLNDPNYKDVQYNPKTGGLKATHVGHNFDKKGGEYEKHVRDAGYNAGNSVILENERGGDFSERFTEGTWNGKKFEVAGCETGTSNNILHGLSHCASKRKTKIAVLYFPKGGFNHDIWERTLGRYRGLKKMDTGQYVEFERIICVQEGEIIIDIPFP